MDQTGVMSKEIVDAMFEQGLMGIEARQVVTGVDITAVVSFCTSMSSLLQVPAEMGGVDLNFTAACLAIEEVAKVDPAVSALMD